MKPIDWLCAEAPGFIELPEEDRQAIMHFSLLWSFFEAETLKINASAAAILAVVHEWAYQGRLNVAAFAESLDYFKARYFKNGTATQHFQGLSLRKGGNMGSPIRRHTEAEQQGERMPKEIVTSWFESNRRRH
ncbi:MAG: hypothetical protein HYY45_17275 [Deltaproteobacteria bacterium]|nr:hypothetical protein [Deltaproteobacteria bacterium]